MRMLLEVGLGYIKVGQQATTLSGGEAQRVKLAKELSRRATGQTLYILDEPTTGLHFEDVRKLLEVLHRLVEQGNTVVVIEHNLDVIKTADWVLDLGPGGGVNGGRIVVEGTPEAVAAEERSFTGQYLKPLLDRSKSAPAQAGAQSSKKPTRSSRVKSRNTDADQPDLIPAK
jgi:excinuclease ABC subunit A